MMSQKEIEQLSMLLEKAKETLDVNGLRPEFILTRKTPKGEWYLRGETLETVVGYQDVFLDDDGRATRKTISIF